MDSGSHPDKPPQERRQIFANILGTAIAVLTLVTPLVAVAFFSSQNSDALRSPPYTITAPSQSSQ